MLFWHEGDYDGAEAGFDMALGKLKDFPPALVGKARIAMGRGELIRAGQLLETAYAQSPLIETAWLLYDDYNLQGEKQKAAALADKLEKQGRRADPRTFALFLASRRPEAAREAVEIAEEELKSRGDVYTQDTYAWALYRAGRLDEARRASDKAIALGTRDARLLFHAGKIRLAQNDATGRALVQKAFKLNPKFDVTLL
jgi:tetratricopeptide (TPR) repeat protein